MVEKVVVAKYGLQCIVGGDVLCVNCPGDGLQGGFKCQKNACERALEVIEQLEKTVEDQAERIAIMSEGGWISVEKRLPDNAEHKGAHCPRYRVYTKWGETVGWYNPDKGCWYFLLWYLDGKGVDFENGDHPQLAHEINGAKVVGYWMPMNEPPKEGAADE